MAKFSRGQGKKHWNLRKSQVEEIAARLHFSSEDPATSADIKNVLIPALAEKMNVHDLSKKDIRKILVEAGLYRIQAAVNC